MTRAFLAMAIALVAASPAGASTLSYSADRGYVFTGTAGPDELSAKRVDETSALTFTDEDGTIDRGTGLPADCTSTTPGQVDCATGADLVMIVGGDGADRLDGTTGDDVLRPGLGADRVIGRGGFDTLDHSADGRKQGIEVEALKGPDARDRSQGHEQIVLTEHDDYVDLRTDGSNLTVNCGPGADVYDPSIAEDGTFVNCEARGFDIGRPYSGFVDVDEEAEHLFTVRGRAVVLNGFAECSPGGAACRVRLSLDGKFTGPDCDRRVTSGRSLGNAEFKIPAGQRGDLVVNLPSDAAARYVSTHRCLSLRVGIVKGQRASMRRIYTGTRSAPRR